VPEYWIVDLDAKAVEVWRLRGGAEAPEVPEVVGAEGRLRWTPLAEGPTLEVTVQEMVAGT
jgi:Uma2 family endonuclease